ncbi:MAG TPA: hypothetical protein VMN60_12920 [Longimicrobiales bacterium]|nr:hypothetical protein [Longimicrobiales bacterium]
MSQPSHSCTVLLTGLGDVVHGLPVVNALKRAWPVQPQDVIAQVERALHPPKTSLRDGYGAVHVE